MPEVNFSLDVSEVVDALRTADRWVGPYVTWSALNSTVYDAAQAEQKALSASFERPVRLTTRAVLYAKVPRGQLTEMTASVFIQDEIGGGGVPPARYLSAEIDGGPRRPKSHELRLRRAGILGPNEFAEPARGVPLDAYGNLQRGALEQMLSELLTAGQFGTGYFGNVGRAKKRAGMRRSSRYFFARGDGHLARGIYERMGLNRGARIRGFLIFVGGAPDYRPRYRFGEAARAEAGRVFWGHWTAKSND